MERDKISKSRKHKLNRDITAEQVRLIGLKSEQLGIVSLGEAFSKRDEASSTSESKLDLVELQPNAEPPVCRIMDYGKFLFQLKKKQTEAKKKQKQVQLKELKFRPGTDEGDYQVKLRNLRRFIENGDKVKITVRFRGREMSHRELGMEMLQRLEKDVEEIASVVQFPKMEGRQMMMVIAPGKASKGAPRIVVHKVKPAVKSVEEVEEETDVTTEVPAETESAEDAATSSDDKSSE